MDSNLSYLLKDSFSGMRMSRGRAARWLPLNTRGATTRQIFK